MIITSDYTKEDKPSDFSRWKSTVSYISTIIAYSLVLAMSYDTITPDMYIMIISLIISLMAGNMSYTSMSKKHLKKLVKNPFSVTLQQHTLLGPIAVLLTFVMLGTLITFNMFMWYIFVGYLIVASIISDAHKSRLGVKND